MGIPDHFTCLLRKLYGGQEAIIRTRHGTMDWFVPNPTPLFQLQLGKELAYLTYVQSTSCEIPDWMKYKLESRLPGEISINSDMQMTPPLWQKERGTKEPLDEVKEESEKAGLKLNIQNTKIMASGPILHVKQMGKQWKQ